MGILPSALRPLCSGLFFCPITGEPASRYDRREPDAGVSHDDDTHRTRSPSSLRMLLGWSHAAPADTAAPLKTEIDLYIHRIETSTGGRLHWDGADRFDVKESGDTATAMIANAASVVSEEAGRPKTDLLAHARPDRNPPRRRPHREQTSPNMRSRFRHPRRSRGSDGTEITVSLKDGRMSFVLEAPGDHQRAIDPHPGQRPYRAKGPQRLSRFRRAHVELEDRPHRRRRLARATRFRT